MNKPLPSQQRLHHLFYCVGGRLINRLARQGCPVGAVVGQVTCGPRGRRQTSVDGVTYLNSRLVYVWYYGVDPGEYEVDHVDDDRLNDDGWNLQPLTSDDNNRKRRARDLPTGVYRRPSGRYRADVSVGGVRHRSPDVDTVDQALAYRSVFLGRA